MSRLRFRPALVGTLLLTACLTPTDGSGRFGEARVHPEFSAGNSPADLGVDIDSIRTIIERADGSTAVNAVMAYEADSEQAWIIELQSAADDMEVTIALMVRSNVAYSGARIITVAEGTAGRATAAPVPVSYVGSDIAERVEVTPDEVALGALGATRQLQATVYDANDVVMSNKVVTWTSVNDGVATVDQSGLVTATGQGVTSITASVDGVSDATTVFVDTMLARSSTISADSASIAADSASSTLLTVRILDTNGQPINASAGPVTLATTLGSLSGVTDHANGTYTATLTAGNTAGLAVVSGMLDGELMSDSALVEFRPLVGDPTTTVVTADSAALNADGHSASIITVTVLDANGNAVGASAGVVALTSTLGVLSEVTDHLDGTYSALFTAGTAIGEALIGGTLNGVAMADSALIALRPLAGDAGSTTITADSAAIDADGESSTLVIVRVLDQNGNPVGASAGAVVLSSALGDLTQPVDHNDGTYTATLTAGIVAGSAEVTGTLNGAAIDDTARVTLRPLTDGPLNATITADSAAIDADGEASTLVTVRVFDANGNPVGASAGVVTLATTLGTLTQPPVDHNDGTYTATLTAGTVAGIAEITGTLNGAAIDDTARVTLRPLTPSPLTTTITADSAAIDADGQASTLVTVRVFDANGNSIGASAGVVTLATTLGTLTQPPVDHNDGTYTALLTAGTTAGVAEITGTLNGEGIADTARVTLRALAPSPLTTTITADSTAINADGAATTLVTVRVFDANGNPVGASAGPITLAASLGTLTQPPVDHNDGTYTALLTAGTTAGVAEITGTLNGEGIADTARVTLRALAPSPLTTTITADSTSILADGVSTTIVTVSVRDNNGNPVRASAGNVTLASTIGILSDVTDHNDGTYTATLRANVGKIDASGINASVTLQVRPDTAVVTGTLNGAAIADSARVEFRPVMIQTSAAT
ncbi:MAG TPA: invasin domain 3-containing protein, partial [Longimicrobiales bacterium]